MAKVQIKSDNFTAFGGVLTTEVCIWQSWPLEGKYTYRCITTNDYEMSLLDVVHFYNQRGSSERIFDELNNGFGWRHLPKSFMAENTVFLIVTVLIRNLYKLLMSDVDIKCFDLKKKAESKTSSSNWSQSLPNGKGWHVGKS